MVQPNLKPQFTTRDFMKSRLLNLRSELNAVGVRHAAIFGSVARGDDMPESDVDIIVDLDPDAHVGLFQFAGIAMLLEDGLNRRVDIMSRTSLRPCQHDEILADLIEVF